MEGSRFGPLCGDVFARVLSCLAFLFFLTKHTKLPLHWRRRTPYASNTTPASKDVALAESIHRIASPHYTLDHRSHHIRLPPEINFHSRHEIHIAAQSPAKFPTQPKQSHRGRES
mmetsp:Transcript_20960/g.51648  ORF Transcript_20960/g.51648 Transcript_20960/m.51648 type:complete len:115 (-) Transcript_20960:630-974(-)